MAVYGERAESSSSHLWDPDSEVGPLYIRVSGWTGLGCDAQFPTRKGKYRVQETWGHKRR